MLSVILGVCGLVSVSALEITDLQDRLNFPRCRGTHSDGFCIDYTKYKCTTMKTSYYGCGYHEMCCYHDSAPKTTQKPNIPTSGSGNLFPEDDCGRPSINPSAKIVGGETTSIEAHPWQILIRRNGYHHCGGSLINDLWVLTAAHCLVGFTGLDIVVGTSYTTRYSRSQIFSIAGAVTHPDYKTKGADIALIKLTKRVDLSDRKTSAVCMANSTDNFDSEKCIVSGWGNTAEKGYTSTVLRNVAVPMVPRRRCESYMGRFPDKMLCAGFTQGGKDACQGDSGGPLICKRGGRWVQAGVVSNGAGCARKYRFGFYTSVAGHRAWIERIVNHYSG